MKSAILTVVSASIVLNGLTAFGAGCNGQRPNGGQPGMPPYSPASPYGAASPYGPTANMPSIPLSPGLLSTLANAAVPAGPKARINVVDVTSQSNVAAANRGPAARLTLVADTNVNTAKAPAIQVATTESEKSKEVAKLAKNEEKPVAKPAPAEAKPEETTIASALKGLVGTWRGVARHGDGELATIELQLDDRGWATVTLPGADGKPSTVNRRVEFDNQEIKLTGPESVSSLGKLLEFDAHQMVLERADGKITFLRV